MEHEIMERATHRLKIIEGQVRGLIKGVDEHTYCPDLITQSLSIQESLKSFNALMLEHHVRTHVREQIEAGKLDQVVDELTKIYKLNGK